MGRFRITGSNYLTKTASIDRFIETLVIKGASKMSIEDECKSRFGVGPVAVSSSLKRIADRWSKEEEERRPLWKMAQVSRINEHINDAKSKGKWDAIARLENLLSDITGTKEPIKIQISHQITVAMMSVIGNLTEEEIASMVKEQRQLEKDAAIGRMVQGVEESAEDDLWKTWI